MSQSEKQMTKHLRPSVLLLKNIFQGATDSEIPDRLWRHVLLLLLLLSDKDKIYCSAAYGMSDRLISGRLPPPYHT